MTYAPASKELCGRAFTVSRRLIQSVVLEKKLVSVTGRSWRLNEYEGVN